MITENSVVTGNMLEDLRELLGLSTGDFCWLFGLSLYNWTLMKDQSEERRDPDTKLLRGEMPVADPAIALYARYLYRYPEACPVPRNPDIHEVYETLNTLRAKAGEAGVNKKEFGVALGREASAGYRWIMQNRRPTPILNRILKIIEDRTREEGNARIWDEWRSLVEIEARNRDIANIWHTGNWQKPQKRAA